MSTVSNNLSSAPPCSEGDVRLLLERVQICHNQTWGYVCYDRDWNVEDVSVVCRELGLLPPQGRLHNIVDHNKNIIYSIYNRI